MIVLVVLGLILVMASLAVVGSVSGRRRGDDGSSNWGEGTDGGSGGYAGGAGYYYGGSDAGGGDCGGDGD